MFQSLIFFPLPDVDTNTATLLVEFGKASELNEASVLKSYSPECKINYLSNLKT